MKTSIIFLQPKGLIKEKTFFVKTLTGKIIRINVSGGTVEDLMKAVEEKEGIPMDQQRIRIIQLGSELESDHSLANLEHESTLYLVLRLRGGGECTACL